MASESIDSAAAGAGGGAIDLLISIARWRLEEQISRVSSLDTKVTATFTLNAAVVALFGAALALSPGALAWHVWALFASVLALFVVSLAFAYRAMQRRDWLMRPSLAALDELIEQVGALELKIWDGPRDQAVDRTQRAAAVGKGRGYQASDRFRNCRCGPDRGDGACGCQPAWLRASRAFGSTHQAQAEGCRSRAVRSGRISVQALGPSARGSRTLRDR